MANTAQNVVAVFDDFDTARNAENELLNNGFSRDEVNVTSRGATETVASAGMGSAATSGAYVGTTATGGATASGAGTTTYTETRQHEGGISGFFQRLFGGEADEDDTERDHYAEAVRRGSAILTVSTSEQSRLDRATDILNRFNPVDIDERVGFYREGGYTGYDTSAAPYTAEQAASERTAFREKYPAENERAIPVVEESLQVGKRAVRRGGVRVYTSVSERPVEESISLHEERVSVNRRPVNRAATDADFRQDEVIELVETGEEAVVAKSARVVEEVVIGKQASDRKQTVKDTVRRTDVRVENIPPDAEADFQRDYQANYGNVAGSDFETYEPAYAYGYEAAGDPKYKGKNWNDVEDTLRTDYLRANPNSTWDNTKGAIRYGWEKVTGKR